MEKRLRDFWFEVLGCDVVLPAFAQEVVELIALSIECIGLFYGELINFINQRDGVKDH